MPRIANETAAILADFQRRLERLVETARKEGREDALAEVRRLVGGGAKRGRPRQAAKKPAKRKKKRRNPWDHMTPAQRKERVRKMLAGRGLKPKRGRQTAKK